MPAVYKIHPGLGIARLGNSPDEFCISPEKPAVLPTACDSQGNPLLSPDGKSEPTITKFKDSEGRIKRQAARFQVYVYDEDSPEGRPIKLGDNIAGGGNEGVLVDIQWRVYLANKKAVWYDFDQLEGEHGYAADHRRRNSAIMDTNERQQLVIDPGPQVVNCTDRRRADFSRTNEIYAPTFPPELKPNSIDTLGDVLTDEAGRLLVLGGHGHSGSFLYSEFGQPRINDYANNDGWFDDTSDGPVMARLVMYSPNVDRLRFVDVEYPAWVLVGYPAYVPQILDMVTLEEVIYDMNIRNFASRTDLFGKPGTFDKPERIEPTDTNALIHWKAGTLEWNPNYKPWFYRDIWTILFRPDEFDWLTNVLAQSNFPHDQTARGNFDVEKLSVPPVVNERALQACKKRCVQRNESGELFLDALTEKLTLIDSSFNARLRRSLAEFDEDLRALMAGFEAQGRDFSEGDKDGYKAWLRDLRETYPQNLGDKLYDRLGSKMKAILKQYIRAVHGEKGPPAFEMIKQARDANIERLFSQYKVQWRAHRDEDEERFEKAKHRVEEAARKAVEDVRDESERLWREMVEKRDTLFKKWGTPFQQLRRELAEAVQKYIHKNVFEVLANRVDEILDKFRTEKLLNECEQACIKSCTFDPFRDYRRYLYELLREPGEENHFRLGGQPNQRTYNLPLMPLLAGDNPISNTLPSKFLRLTDYQLFLLRQWADGNFYNEKSEGWADPDPFKPYAAWQNNTGSDLDRGVLSNLLGGAFCPGGEVGWIARNPAIYHEPFRIKADPAFYSFRLTAAQANARSGSIPDQDYASYSGDALGQDSDFDKGLEPGDLTKYMALPWQSDFNECSTQDINITYEEWNRVYPESEGDSLLQREEQVWETMWWPAHRPLQTYEITGAAGGGPSYQMLNWSRGIPATNAGDLKMVSAWSELGFVVRNPFESPEKLDQPSPINGPVKKYISVERNDSEEI